MILKKYCSVYMHIIKCIQYTIEFKIDTICNNKSGFTLIVLFIALIIHMLAATDSNFIMYI